MGAPVIAAHGLTKTYGRTRVVDGLSFGVEAGTVTAFLGPNGAGKTTTIRLILGLARPDAGEAAVFGQPFRRLARPMSRVGVLIDGSAVHPLRTGRNQLRILAAAGGIPGSRIAEVLDLVELTDAADKKVGSYSLGMRQRLGLAAALLGDPDLVILDEPANGLDPAGIRWLREFLTSFARSGRTVFISSHVLSEVAQLADHVVVINRGKLVMQVPIGGLTTAGSVTARTPEPDRLRRILAGLGATVRHRPDGKLEIGGLAIERVGEAAACERLVLHELSPRNASLEEVFLQLTAIDGEDDARAA